MTNAKRVEKTADEVFLFEDERYRFSRKGPQRKLSAADLDGDCASVIETLYSEHGYILSLLDALEKQAAKLKPGKIPDYHLLLEVIDYLTHYPGKYHHPREDLLFAALLKRDKKFRARLERLQREHVTLHEYNERIFKLLDSIAKGRPVDSADLLASLQRYIAGYRKHLDYESREIFPLAQGVLSAAQLRKINASTRFIDDPLFGSEVSRRYRRLGRNLQLRVDDFRAELVARQFSLLQVGMDSLTEFAIAIKESAAGEQVCKLGAAPSWQARLMNVCTRTFMKPMMRYGSIESMRTMTQTLDAQGERNLPADINSKRVQKSGYRGEWIRIAGQRTRRIILYFPGGGFIIRTATQHKAFVARICRAANARALLVHYSLAPEVPFPGGLEDCLAAYHDLLRQGIAASDITIAGDSAGGGLVLSTLLALRDEGSALPANAIVLSPLADLTYSGASRVYNKHKDPMLPTHRASEMHQLYIGDSLPEDRFISPIFADFDGLPPLLAQVGSTEILLDDTLRVAAQAERAGVPFCLEVWEQMPHVFPIFRMLPESQIAIERMAQFIVDSTLDTLPEQYGSHAGIAA